MSAFGGKADLTHYGSEGLLIANNGLLGATPNLPGAPKWRKLECQHAISGESQLRSSHVPLPKSGIGKMLLGLNGDSQIVIRPAAIGGG